MATLRDSVLKEILATRLDREVYWVDPLTGEAHRRVERVPLAADEPAHPPVAEEPAKAPLTEDLRPYVDEDIWDEAVRRWGGARVCGTIDAALPYNINAGVWNELFLKTIARRLKRLDDAV